MSTCQQNSSVPARRRAHPEVELRGRAERAAEGAQRRGDHRRAGVVLLEARLGPARDHAELERRPRGPRADEDRLVVDRDEAVAAAHLLGRDVLEQVGAHRALVVRGRALALAGDLGGHEAERVELGVAVLERGAGVGALVDDQVNVGGVGMGAHPLAPGGDGAGDLLVGELGQRGEVLGSADDHLVGAVGRLRAKQVGLGAAGTGRERVDRAGETGLRRPLGARPTLAPGQRRAPDRDWGPSAAASRACRARRRRDGEPRPRAGFGPRGPRRRDSARRRRGGPPPGPARTRPAARRAREPGPPAGR